MKSKQKEDKLYEAAVAKADEWLKEIRSTKPRLETLRYLTENLNKYNSFRTKSRNMIDLKGGVAVFILLGMELVLTGILRQVVIPSDLFLGILSVSFTGILFAGAAVRPREWQPECFALEELSRKDKKEKNKLRYDSISDEEREYWKLHTGRYKLEHNTLINRVKLRYLNGCFVCIILNFFLLGGAVAVQLLYSGR